MIPKTLLLLSLCLLMASTGPLCPQGQASINAKCTQVDFIEGCYSYSGRTKCQECEFNYQLIGDICDYQESDKSKCCVSFDSNGECNKCEKGLFLRSGGCLQANLVGCIEKDFDKCTNCATGFHIKNNRCVKSVRGCASYNTDGTCEACSPSFTFNQGVCQETIINGCKKQSSGACQQCYSPFKLINGVCTVDNCQTLSDFGCGVCQSGFFLKSDGLCYPSDVGCSVYRGGACVVCKYPFSLENGLCRLDGCNTYGSNNLCTQCSSPYKLSNGFCKIENCEKASKGLCKVCESGFHIHNGTCLKPLQNCVDSIYEVCRLCAPGFYLGPDSHCRKYANGCSYKDGKCTSCYSPFTFGRDNTCYIQGCLEYDSKGCTKCINSNFLLTDGVCRLPLCANIVDNKCKDCVKGYIIRNEQCVAVDEYCLKFDTKNFCYECKPGFYLDSSSYCKKQTPGCNYINGSVVSCRQPFIFDPITKKCQIDGCAEYFDGGCKTCPTPYVKDYNNCKLPNCTQSLNGLCLKCDEKFVPVNGVCKTKDIYCSVYNSKGVCESCVKDYFLTSFNTCIRKVAGCIYTGEKCTSCYSPFIFSSGTCNIEGCQQYSDKGCAECKYPYELNCYGVCGIPNCLQTKNGLCVKCGPGFHSKKGICESNDANCLSYSDNGNCDQCVKGFAVLDDGNCHLRDLHCISFDQNGNCLACDADYYVNTFKTCSVRQSGCKTYNKGVCSECQDRFYIWNDLCRPFRKGCAKYEKGVCVACLPNYTLDSGKALCLAKVGIVTYNDIDMEEQFEDTFNDLKFKTITKVVSQTNLVSISSSATFVYSSIWDLYFNNPQIDEVFAPCKPNSGWKANAAQTGQWVGYRVSSPRTFYQVVVQSGADNAYLKTIDIQYTLDGTTYKKLGQSYDVSASASGSAVINFKAIYAIEIRIIVLEFVKWPSCRFEFFASNLNQNIDCSGISTTQIGTFISGNVENKLNLQANTNIRNFFNPARDCSVMDTCWAGSEFPVAKTVSTAHILNNQATKGSIDQYYVDYSTDGSKFVCYNDCKPTSVPDLTFSGTIRCKKIRIHPTKWTGTPEVKFTFDIV